jgi:hypothetical protein
MTTAGQMSPQTAPRDVEKLQLLGPFMLKRLMEVGLPMLNMPFDEPRRQAFMRDPIDKRAKDVLEVLLQIDAAGGGAPAPAEAPAPAPAAAAAPEEAGKPARTPVTRSRANGAATNGAASPGDNGDALAVLQGIAGVIKEVSTSIQAMSVTVKSVETGAKKIENLDARITEVFRMQHLTMGVLAQIAENTLGAPMEDILAQVQSDYGRIQPIIEKLVSGK